MRQLIYALQFNGTGAPIGGAANHLKATTAADSCAILSSVGSSGLSGKIEAVQGAKAEFESEVKVGDGGRFQERGTITFGSGNSVAFETVGEGIMGPSPIEGLMHGVVCWRVISGEGQFSGASGLITSNFTVDGQGKVVDHHFGVLWVP